AGAAGVTAAAVKSLERGRNSPTWETVVALCRALDVTPDTFAQAPGVPAAAAGPPPQSSADPEPPGGKPKRRDPGAGPPTQTPPPGRRWRDIKRNHVTSVARGAMARSFFSHFLLAGAAGAVIVGRLFP